MKLFARNTGKIEILFSFAGRIWGIAEKVGAERGSAGTPRFLQKPYRTARIPEKPLPA